MKRAVWREFYTRELLPDLVHNQEPKEHNFRNHLAGFLEALKRQSHAISKQKLTKRHVYVVKYRMNTSSEINGDRPSIIYKASHSTLGDDVIVIPLRSAQKQKQPDKFDIPVLKDGANKLFQNSYARLRQIRSVSVKRIGRVVGEIKNEDVIRAINEGIKIMLATDE